jgi:hypothetical protein
MTRSNVKAATAERPNRLLVALAAAWMVLSLAIGGVLWSDSSAQASAPDGITRTASQP